MPKCARLDTISLHDISARYGHDTDRLVDHYIELQEEMKKSGKYRFVTGFFATDEPAGVVEKK